ncbi:MAG: succinate dehydrogenase/fumarate reductase iron-sulfur subunit, partial [Roseinatronobacter sp.]
MSDRESITVTVQRGGPETPQYPQEFEVPAFESQTVLDVVSWIQQNVDPTLTYRFACRVGMCGSCAMMVNGVPRWTCRTHVNKVLKGGKIEVGPLRNLPVIKDLAADMDPFFDKW